MTDLKPCWIVCHHSGGTDAYPLQDSSNYTLEQCNKDHKVRFNMLSSLNYYVAYNYFMDKNGIITQTRTDFEEGCHCTGYNNSDYDKLHHPENLAIGICLAGNFDATLPTQAQINSLTKFLKEKTTLYEIPTNKIVPHRTFAIKTCYGNRLPNTWAADLLKISTNSSVPQMVPTPTSIQPKLSLYQQIMLNIQKYLSGLKNGNGQKP